MTQNLGTMSEMGDLHERLALLQAVFKSKSLKNQTQLDMNHHQQHNQIQNQGKMTSTNKGQPPVQGLGSMNGQRPNVLPFSVQNNNNYRTSKLNQNLMISPQMSPQRLNVISSYLAEEPYYESISPVPSTRAGIRTRDLRMAGSVSACEYLCSCDSLTISPATPGQNPQNPQPYHGESPLSSTYDSPIRSNTTFFLRAGIREQIQKDGVDFSRIPDEATLRAISRQYALDLCQKTAIPQGVTPVEFRQEFVQQMRDLWLEHRRKSRQNLQNLQNFPPQQPVQNRTPTTFDRPHQYLQHVIISPNNSLNPPPLPLPNNGGNQIQVSQNQNQNQNYAYTPGIYSPSSCLVEKDSCEIYEYVPPSKGTYNSPSKRNNGTPSKLKKSKSTSTIKTLKDSSKGAKRSFSISTIRNRNSKSSYEVTSSQSCANISSISNSSETQTKELQPCSPAAGGGCNSMAKFSKLSRRLGLSRFFRTLKVNHQERPGPLELRNRRQNSNQNTDDHNYGFSKSAESIVPLPANERIIETINRLKFEQLQRRRERIAQEHQMILKELKVSMNSNGPSKPDGPSSIFYVPNSTDLSSSSFVTSPSSDYNTSTDQNDLSVAKKHNYDLPHDDIKIRDPKSDLKLSKSNSRRKCKSDGCDEKKIDEFLDTQDQNDKKGKKKVSKANSSGNLWISASSKSRRNRCDSTSSDMGSSTRDSSSSAESFSEMFARSLMAKFRNNKNSGGDDVIVNGEENTVTTRRGSEGQSPPTKNGGFLGRVRSGLSFSGRRNQSISADPSPNDGSGPGVDGNYDCPRQSSGDEESLNQNITPPPTEIYDGPYVGRAVALVDNIPSPYDRHALRYKKGQIIEIISKKPTGLWTGQVGDQVGHFKFINVQVLPESEDENEEYSDIQGGSELRRHRSTHNMNGHSVQKQDPHHHQDKNLSKSFEDSGTGFRQRQMRENGVKSEQQIKRNNSMRARGRPTSVGDLLQRINLEDYISVFILHGFETLDLFKELEEEDLDRLEILDQNDRTKILTAVELLREFEQHDNPDSNSRNRQVQNHLREPRDSGVFLERAKSEVPNGELLLNPQTLDRIDNNSRVGHGKSYPDLWPSTHMNMAQNGHQQQQNGIAIINQNMSSAGVCSSLKKNAHEYVEVRQRFLQAKSMFETAGFLSPRVNQYGQSIPFNQSQSQGQGHGQVNGKVSQGQGRFLKCEKSSDSGISTGSPPPLRN